MGDSFHLNLPMTDHRFPLHGAARAVALVCAVYAAAPLVYAAPACSVTDVGVTPAGCAATSSWSGTGDFEPSILSVIGGGTYNRASGLYVFNSNAVAGNTGTRGIYVSGQSAANVASRVEIGGYVPITIHVTNVSSPDDNDGLYVGAGAQVLLHGALNAVTTTAGNPAYQARAITVGETGTGPLAGTHSNLTVQGTLEADTTGAATTQESIRVATRGEIQAKAGGTVKSAMVGIHAYDGGAFESDSTTPMAITAGTHAALVEGPYNATMPVARVTLANGTLQATASAVVLTSNVASASTGAAFSQSGGSITSSQGSAIVFASGSGPTNVWLANTTVQSNAPLGPGPDGYASGLVAYSTAQAAHLVAVDSQLNGHMAIDAPGRLWLTLSNTQWNTGGDPATANAISLTGISGGGTITMPDVLDRITLTGAPAGVFGETGCGTANLTLVVPTSQRAPPSSPHAVMVCQNADTHPTMTLQGGAVVLGGYSYTLQTLVADGRAVYQLVRGAPAEATQVNPVPALSSWGLLLLSGLLGLLGLRRRGS